MRRRGGPRPTGSFDGCAAAAAALLLSLVAGPACAAAPPALPRPALPRRAHVVLPLQDPFISEALAVSVRLVGPGAVTAHEMFVVDSGASLSVLREPLVRRLGLSAARDARVATVDPLGVQRDYQGAKLPELWLGGVVVRDMTAAVLGHDNLLGHDILGQVPWEVDLDGATFTLDAAAWPEGGALARVPLQDIQRTPGGGTGTITSFGQRVLVRLNGREVPMKVDTGASTSALPRAMARGLGLTARSDEETQVGTAHSSRAAAALVTADLSIGAVRVGARPFVVLPEGAQDQALLGMDVLRLFRFRVQPGQWLELAPRGDGAAASARLQRWPWLPRCPQPGCAAARLEGSGDGAAVVMTVSADLPSGPTSFLWRCPSQGGRREPAPGLGVFLPAARAGQTVRLVPRGAAPGWSASFAGRCGELELVDVNSAGLAVRQLGAVAAVLTVYP